MLILFPLDMARVLPYVLKNMKEVHVQISIDQNGKAESYAVSGEPFTAEPLKPGEPVPMEHPYLSYDKLRCGLIEVFEISPSDVPPLEYFQPDADEAADREDPIYRTVPKPNQFK